MLPHICGVPYLHVNRPLLNWAVIFIFLTIKWKLSLLQTPPLRTVSLVPNTASFIHTLPSNKGHFPAIQTLEFVSFGSLRVAYSLSDVWIDEASSDATTRKMGSDFGWLIVQSFALSLYVYLWAILARLLIFRGSNACLELKKKMAIFIVNSKIALVFETMTC